MITIYGDLSLPPSFFFCSQCVWMQRGDAEKILKYSRRSEQTSLREKLVRPLRRSATSIFYDDDGDGVSPLFSFRIAAVHSPRYPVSEISGVESRRRVVSSERLLPRIKFAPDSKVQRAFDCVVPQRNAALRCINNIFLQLHCPPDKNVPRSIHSLAPRRASCAPLLISRERKNRSYAIIVPSRGKLCASVHVTFMSSRRIARRLSLTALPTLR